jgi:hypothetical protein
MVENSRFAAAVFAVILIAATPLASAAQTQPAAPSAATDPLADLIAHLQDNINDFKRTVPSFFCNEHIVSEMTSGIATGSQRTIIDATFRIRRAEDPKDPDDAADAADNITQHNQLQESRVITMINGKSTAGEKARADAPFSVFGLFSGGLSRVSTAGNACFSYQLRPARPGHKGDKIEIDFVTLPQQMLTNCPYKEKATGRALIDPATLQVVRLENMTVDADGTWNYAIDYAPVALGGKTFNLPTTITSTESNQVATQGNPALHLPPTTVVTYHLVSRYTNYHLRAVTSKIVLP